MAGLEPVASATRPQRSPKLSYIPEDCRTGNRTRKDRRMKPAEHHTHSAKKLPVRFELTSRRLQDGRTSSRATKAYTVCRA